MTRLNCDWLHEDYFPDILCLLNCHFVNIRQIMRHSLDIYCFLYFAVHFITCFIFVVFAHVCIFTHFSRFSMVNFTSFHYWTIFSY